MSKKQKIYTAEFKTKIVLELLAGDQTLAQIASKYSLISRSIQNWKKMKGFQITEAEKGVLSALFHME